MAHGPEGEPAKEEPKGDNENSFLGLENLLDSMMNAIDGATGAATKAIGETEALPAAMLGMSKEDHDENKDTSKEKDSH